MSFFLITAVGKKEWAHSVGLRGRMRPVVEFLGSEFGFSVPRHPLELLGAIPRYCHVGCRRSELSVLEKV